MTECRCNCGYTCQRQCGLEILDCIEKHYVRDCDHRWDGPTVEFSMMGLVGSSITCSVCGMRAADHDLEVGP